MSNQDISAETNEMVNTAYNSCYDEVLRLYTDCDFPQEKPMRLNIDTIEDDEIPYIEYFEDHKDVSKYPNPQKLERILHLVYQVLGYVTMSPKNEKIHNDTYVIDRRKIIKGNIEAHLRNKNQIEINSCEGELIELFDFWVKKAIALSKFEDLTFSARDLVKELSIYLILGKPGVGKTALLNYLVSADFLSYK
jgi:hypothetical protein